MTTPPSPWTSAESHCWSIVVRATEVQKIVNALRDIAVTAVIPLISSTAPSILITPERPEDTQHLNWLCGEIRKTLDESNHWTTVEQGPYWSLRLRSHGVSIDIATHVVVATPNAFAVTS